MKKLIVIALALVVSTFVLGGLCVTPADAKEIVLYQSTFIKGKELPRKKKMQDQFMVPPVVESLRLFLSAADGSKSNVATVVVGGTMVHFSDQGEAEISLGGGRLEAMKERDRAARQGRKVSSPPSMQNVEVSVYGKDGTSVNLIIVGVINPAALHSGSGR